MTKERHEAHRSDRRQRADLLDLGFPVSRGDGRGGASGTEAIWLDMQGFDGYLSHELLVDADDPGHLLVVSRWTSRERADATLQLYATHPNARSANSLVAEPRRRFVATRAEG